MIMYAASLLNGTRKPSEAQIRDALANNLCRCGTRLRIVRALAAEIVLGRTARVTEAVKQAKIVQLDQVDGFLSISAPACRQRFPGVSQVVIDLIERPNEKSWGAGEPSAAVVPSAIGNTIFDATGARLRSVPFLPWKVLAAL